MNMPRHRPPTDPEPFLFEMGSTSDVPEAPTMPHEPALRLWSRSKARLIAEYLRLFVLVTKHGTYIDGFAGPQVDEDCWSARRVLETEPDWLRHFHLCDISATAVKQLEALRAAHPGRDIHVYQADFNAKVDEILDVALAGKKEAAFCLLDQRTFQCRWATVEKLARFKQPSAYKIELFYFLANGWLDRAMAATTTPGGLEAIADWWGGDSWRPLRGAHHTVRARMLSDRFRNELGYRFAVPWQIYERGQGTPVMYYMIHATDHPVAPGLMARAYRSAVLGPSPPQLDLFTDMG